MKYSNIRAARNMVRAVKRGESETLDPCLVAQKGLQRKGTYSKICRSLLLNGSPSRTVVGTGKNHLIFNEHLSAPHLHHQQNPNQV